MLVIANADAGTADGLEDALRALDCDVVHTTTPEELDDVVRRDRFLVAAGGDGTLHAVVAAMHRQDVLADTALGLIPLGTGNDFARGAGIPLDPLEAAQLVAGGKPSPVDLLMDDAGGVVVNSVHVGAGAEASRAAQPWKRRLGPVGYLVGAGIAAVRPAAPRLRVTVDGEVVSHRRTLQVALGNAPYVGGGTELTPKADPADGRVDVMVSFALSPLARAAYALQLRRGEHHHSDDVLYGRGHEVAISGEEFYASSDGEIEGPLTSRSWRLMPGALQFVLSH